VEIRDLNDDERLALVGLIEFVAESNRSISEEEQKEIADLAGAFGPAEYRALVDEVDRRFADEAALRAHLRRVGRQEARELIYGLALETALSDPEGLQNPAMLDWLRGEWNVAVQIRSS